MNLRSEAVELFVGGIQICSSVVEISFNGLRMLFQRKSDLVLEDKLNNNKYENGSSSKVSDEENCALVAKAKKGKNEKASQSGTKGKKQDMSKVKCFHCHQHEHYATNCPQKKKNKQAIESSTGEVLASQFELDFSLIACLVSSVMGSVQFLDSGASFHMTEGRYLFSDLENKDLGVHIEMGDDGRYSATGIDTISFERDFGKPFVLKGSHACSRIEEESHLCGDVRRQRV